MEVDVITGNEYCRINEIKEIDLLKIDTERFEYKVLKDFCRMFVGQRIKLIQFEYGPMAIDSMFLLSDFHRFYEEIVNNVEKIFP